MKLVFAERALKDDHHRQSADAKILDHLITLIKETSRTPFQGIGKPEPLRGVLSGWCRAASSGNTA